MRALVWEVCGSSGIKCDYCRIKVLKRFKAGGDENEKI